MPSTLKSQWQKWTALIADSWHQEEKGVTSKLVMLCRLFYAYTFQLFSLTELRLYAPHIAAYRKNMPVFISKERSIKKLKKINAIEKKAQTEDKWQFAQICEANSLPCPRTVFVNDESIAPFSQWMLWQTSGEHSKIVLALPDAFIVKNRKDAYGSDFLAFTKVNEVLRDHEGREWTITQFMDYYRKAAPVIAQERLYDLPSLSEWSDTHCLQSVRITTFREHHDCYRVLYFALKLIKPGNVVDNFSGGRIGNLLAIGDKATGVLNCAVTTRSRGGVGLVTIDRLPQNGKSINGYQVPQWQSAVALAKKAHAAFPNHGAIGWDIALTENGPVLLEGNMWWDPPMYAPWIMEGADWRSLFGKKNSEGVSHVPSAT